MPGRDHQWLKIINLEKKSRLLQLKRLFNVLNVITSQGLAGAPSLAQAKTVKSLLSIL